MKFNTFGVDKIEGQREISAKVNKDGTAIFKTASLTVNRKITSCGHYIRIIDTINNVSYKDLGLILEEHNLLQRQDARNLPSFRCDRQPAIQQERCGKSDHLYF
jgi:hypothetical protein